MRHLTDRNANKTLTAKTISSFNCPTMTTENLNAQDAVAKIKEMAESIDFTMLCTDLASSPFHAIPMSTKKVDDSGSVWFLSGKDSTHNDNILKQSKVELLYSSPSSMQFLSIFGEASIHTDQAILQSLYGSTDDAWFDGVNDPNLTAIKIKPIDAHYWDTKGNKLVVLMKMGAAAVTGEKADVGKQGDLNV